MTKSDLFVQHRFAVGDVGHAIIAAMAFHGKAEIVWIVRDSRNSYVAVCTECTVGNLSIPECCGYLWFRTDKPGRRARDLQICFGPGVLNAEETKACRANKR